MITWLALYMIFSPSLATMRIIITEDQKHAMGQSVSRYLYGDLV
jgi:hypothetical protein